MMLRRTVMSISRLKTKGNTPAVESTKNMTNTKAQIRALQSKSSPVYKTQSETSLVSGVRNLTILDKPKPVSAKPIRRGFCTGNSGRLNIRSLQDVAKVFAENRVQNVVVVAGAGISTPSGIPDFRTPGTGLYDNLQQYQIPYPEAIFDIDYFYRNPKPFFTLAKELFPSLGNYRPNYIHYFVRLLHEKGLLLRMYTQNIDGLERLAGIPPAKLVEAHGTFATATCTLCGQKCAGEDIKDRILEDKLPKCKKTSCSGMVKPDIVFFGEDLPRKFYYHFRDMLQADVVLVMGTSLEVQPFAGIIESVRWNVPRILFNRDIVGPFLHNRRSKDVVAEGDILQTMQKFIEMIGWKDEMKELIINSEGQFNIGIETGPVVNNLIEKKKSKTKTVINDPFVNAIWRQNTKYNLQDYCSESSSESETSSSESDSSEEENSKPICRQANNRLYNKTKYSASQKLPIRKGFQPSFSTLAPVNRTTKKPSPIIKNKRIACSPVIKSRPYVSSPSPVIKSRPYISPPSPVIKSRPYVSTPSGSHVKYVSKNRNTTPPGRVISKNISSKPPPANTSTKITSRTISNASPGIRINLKDKVNSNTSSARTHITSVQVYKSLRNRSNSADLPRLRLREKLTRNVAESSSNESVSSGS